MNTGPCLWRENEPLVLASASPIRADMLQKAGIPCQTCPAQIDERALEASLAEATPRMVASTLALAKARQVASLHLGRWVLGADQTLDCDGQMLHKPGDAASAKAQISMLAGRRHRLTSAAALLRHGSEPVMVDAEAWLRMRALGDEEIDAYLAHAGASALSSVGCYQIEALGVHLFDEIEGDHFTIMGLPLLALLAQMRRLMLTGP